MARLFPARLSAQILGLIAARFKALSDPTRLKLLLALQDCEHSVTELVRATGANQANVSRHLQTLSEVGILHRRKAGLHVFYSVSDPAIFELCWRVFGSLEKQAQQEVRLLRQTRQP